MTTLYTESQLAGGAFTFLDLFMPPQHTLGLMFKPDVTSPKPFPK